MCVMKRLYLRHEFKILLATLVISVFVMGWVANDARGAEKKLASCHKLYPAPSTEAVFFGLPFYTRPLGIEFVRCLRLLGEPK